MVYKVYGVSKAVSKNGNPYCRLSVGQPLAAVDGYGYSCTEVFMNVELFDKAVGFIDTECDIEVGIDGKIKDLREV